LAPRSAVGHREQLPGVGPISAAPDSVEVIHAERREAGDGRARELSGNLQWHRRRDIRRRS
jgi:hypothetical protein